MSFGGSPDNSPAKPRKPLGVDDSRLSTNEQAKPVPYHAGYQRRAVTFISDVVYFRTKTLEAGGKNGGERTGTKYWASFAALIGYGRLKQITGVYLNDQRVYHDVAEFEGEDFLDITLTNPANGAARGVLRVYAGTETQEPDTYLNLKSASHVPPLPQHPAYRGIAYGVFKELYLGFNQTDVQNIEIEFVREPEISWTTNEIFGGDLAGTSAVVVCAELLQHPRLGLGLPDSLLDTAALAAVHQTLVDEGSVSVLFPFFERQQEVRSLITEALQYCGGFPLITADGKFSIGLYRAPASLAALPVVNESDLVSRPEREAGDWLTAKTETNARFLDVDREFKESSVNWRDRGLIQITGEPNVQSIERNWLLHEDQAKTVVNITGRAAALPQSGGTVALRRTGTLFADLAPGALFKLNYPSRGVANQVCRVQTRTEADGARPQFTIDYKVDFSWLTGASGDDVAPPAAAALVSPDPLDAARVIELPISLCPEGKLTLTVLASRPADGITGFSVHLAKNYAFDGDPVDSYANLASSTRFALRAVLRTDYVATTDLIDQTVGFAVQLVGPDQVLEDFTPFDGVSDEWLVFIGDEIMSLHQATLAGVGFYQLFPIRARHGTERAEHGVGTECFIVQRSALVLLQHPQFALHNDYELKLSTVKNGVALELAEAEALTGTIAGRIYREPLPGNFRARGTPPGSGTEATNGNYETGHDILVQWTRTDGQADFWQAGKISRVLTLEVYDDFDLLVATLTPAGEELTITNTELVGYLGAETNFKLRLFYRTTVEAGYVDSEYLDQPMTLI
jgi:hypothetical protein